MRAKRVYEDIQFRRGDDLSRALRIGRYATVWGDILDDFAKIINRMDSWGTVWQDRTVYEYELSEGGKSVLVCFYNRGEGSVSSIFDVLNTDDFFVRATTIIDEKIGGKAYIGANFSKETIDIFKYNVSEEREPRGFLELALQGI